MGTQRHSMNPEMQARTGATPLVSVVILTYRRREALSRSLAAARAQDYPNLEIIVVDNHSDDGTPEFVRAAAPAAILVEMSRNEGACAGRNAGVCAASGEIIVLLDNDVYFNTPSEVSRIVANFEWRPDVHVLACQLCNEAGQILDREWCHPKAWRDYGQTEFETNYFVEGACAMRRVVFETCGGFYEPLFIFCEGYDFALRIFDAGYRMLYSPNVKLCHLMSQETRTPERPYYFFTRNYIWISFKNFRLFRGLAALAPKLGMMAYFTIRTGHYGAFTRGLWDGLTGIGRVRQDRTLISPSALRRFDHFESLRPPLRVRLARHRVQPQI